MLKPTGTKPKVKRSLFSSTSTDLPLKTDRSNKTRSTVNLPETVPVSAAARRKAYVPSIPKRISTRNSNDTDLVQAVDNPESILRRKKISPWRRLRNKLENTPSLLATVANLISGLSPRSAVTVFKTDVRSTNDPHSVSKSSDLLATAVECAGTLLFPDKSVVSDLNGRTSQPEDPTHCLEPSSGSERSKHFCPGEYSHSSANKTFSPSRESIEPEKPVSERKCFDLDRQYTQSNPSSSGCTDNRPLVSDTPAPPKSAERHLLFPSRVQYEKTPLPTFSPSHTRAGSVVTSEALNNSRKSTDIEPIRNHLPPLFVDTTVPICGEGTNCKFSTPLWTFSDFLSDHSEPKVICSEKTVSGRQPVVPINICDSIRGTPKSDPTTRQGCRPKVRFEEQTNKTTRRPLFPSAPIGLTDTPNSLPIEPILSQPAPKLLADNSDCPPNIAPHVQISFEDTIEPDQFVTSGEPDGKPLGSDKCN